MTEINAQINLRDINNKHDPSQALPRVRSHHTLMLTEGAVDWPSNSISQNQEGRGHLGEELRRQTSVGFSVYSLLLCVVLCFVFQIPFFKYNVHSPSCSGLAPAFFTYHPLLEVIAFFFFFLSFHSCLAVLWLLPKCEMRSNAFPSDNLTGKGRALLLCGFLQFIGLMHLELADKKFYQPYPKGRWSLQIFLTLQARTAERRVNLQVSWLGVLIF